MFGSFSPSVSVWMRMRLWCLEALSSCDCGYDSATAQKLKIRAKRAGYDYFLDNSPPSRSIPARLKARMRAKEVTVTRRVTEYYDLTLTRSSNTPLHRWCSLVPIPFTESLRWTPDSWHRQHLLDRSQFWELLSERVLMRGDYTWNHLKPQKFWAHIWAVITFFSLSSVQIIIVPACCLLCVL